MFSMRPTSWFLSQTLYVFALDLMSAFAVLQSRVHEPWARLLSSSLEDRLRYSASDCLETFPFPHPDPRTVLPDLEPVAERLYTTRAQLMLDTNLGLTKTYNALKDPSSTEPRILALRTLHEDMDRAVLAAYGWSDIAVPPFCPITDADKAALQAAGAPQDPGQKEASKAQGREVEGSGRSARPLSGSRDWPVSEIVQQGVGRFGGIASSSETHRS